MLVDQLYQLVILGLTRLCGMHLTREQTGDFMVCSGSDLDLITQRNNMNQN